LRATEAFGVGRSRSVSGAPEGVLKEHRRDEGRIDPPGKVVNLNG
jgi:hypothetical protein